MAAYISFQPSDHYNTKLYTGTGSSNAVTGVGFQPDFTWIKNRDVTDSHALVDAVRGATKYWKSNSSAAEVTDAESLKSFDSDGFTVGTMEDVNTNTEAFVSWNWKAGTTSGLTGGSITPTGYSLNTTAGQSIIAYTGTGSAATIPHGLGKAPEFILIKSLDLGHDGIVYHEAIGNTYYMKMNNEGKSNSYGAAAWNNTSPTTTVFSEGGNTHLGGSGNYYIAYCYAPIKGYSRFGTYDGNGNADGVFVYTGFRPAWIMLKISNTTGDWYVFDAKREGYNVDNDALLANATTAESTTDYIDICSNGFKLRSTLGVINGSDNPILYAAFAEFPIVSSNSKPGTAR